MSIPVLEGYVSASHLGELEQMGVACLKIEGRMKRPEYVAIVTGVYAWPCGEAEPTAEEMAQLEAAFSRQGFTQGYFLDRKGPEMFGTCQEAPRGTVRPGTGHL
ncbi:MAG: U32 family peptidase [Flavonifractor plautii]